MVISGWLLEMQEFNLLTAAENAFDPAGNHSEWFGTTVTAIESASQSNVSMKIQVPVALEQPMAAPPVHRAAAASMQSKTEFYATLLEALGEAEEAQAINDHHSHDECRAGDLLMT